MAGQDTLRTTGTAGRIIVALAVLAGLAALLDLWSGPGEPTPPSEPTAQETIAGAVPDAEATAEDTVVTEEPLTLSEEDALRGSIKLVSCFPELAGEALLKTEDMAPSHEAVLAMEACLDLTAVRHPQNRSMKLTLVYYLRPDGVVSETGVGADVDSVEAWSFLEPCASSYWQGAPPKLEPTDEKSYSCAYEWSEDSIAGGFTAVRTKVAEVWSGRDMPLFGASLAPPPVP